jgi:protocatechuate 3,4-dioxygenase beta subunit
VTPTPGQPRDSGPQATTGTAVISGRITDADTGMPVRRASIQLGQRNARGEPRAATTDDQGRFEIRELPAGDYFVNVRKAGYASLAFGQRRWSETPRPLTLRNGEVFDKCDVALQRGGVITGRVVDEVGEPVLEANVRVFRQAWFRGRRRMTMSGGGATNDLGVFRVFGLQPGEYFVQAMQRGGARWFARDDTPVDYAPTYYPGTPDVSAARPLIVAASQESIADISLLPVRVTSMAGLVLGSSGKPLGGGRVTAVMQTDGSVAFVFDQPRSAMVKPDGSFLLTGLTPGTYKISATATDDFGGGSGDREFAHQTITVGSENLQGVTLVLARGGVARGRVTFQGVPPQDVTGLRVWARSTEEGEAGFTAGGGPPSPIAADGSFEVKGLVGKGLVGLGGGQGALQGWSVRAVMYGGRDVQDTGIEFAPGRTTSGIEIVMSQDFPSIAGTVSDDRGQPVKDYSVIVFAEDREKWFLPSMRWLKSARGDQDGLFKVENLAGGRFLVIALESVDTNTMGDPDELDKLRAYATEVTLGDNEKKTLQLRLVKP